MDEIVNRHRQLLGTYEVFADRLENLIMDLLKVNGVKVHFSESRAKTTESLLEKLSRPGKSYQDPFDQIPDLAGIRIVLYYQDDVERVGKTIESEFKIIEKTEENQFKKYSPDQFGYLSRHYIVQLNQRRASLAEWSDFKNLHAEIQVRTVLQHSWAAVSHVLQYKREGDVPILLRRKLHRLAGLFELADEQFIEIRDERTRLITESSTSDDSKGSELIDSLSLERYMSGSKIFQQYLHTMREKGFVFSNDPQYDDYDYDYDDEEESDSNDYVGRVVEELERLQVRTVFELEEFLTQDYDKFLRYIYVEHERWQVSDEFALLLLVIASSPGSFSVEDLLRGGWADSVARHVVNGANKAKND